MPVFEPVEGPRIFGMPPGADFPRELVCHILERMKDEPHEALARVRILVNTRRMARRIGDLFADGTPRLLPKTGVVTDLAELAPIHTVDPPEPSLARTLHLARLVATLIDADPEIAPRAAIFDLSESLATLLDEMQGEGVEMSAVTSFDTGDLSGHWDRSRRFLMLVQNYLGRIGDSSPGPEAFRAAIVDCLRDHWETSPPSDPIIVAGSTGSRGTTLRLMELVANLPQGAVVLPGFDADCPPDVWDRLATAKDPSEDHPQFRFAHLLKSLDCDHSDVRHWPSRVPDPARNALVSLSLRPAPVTNQWLSDGPALGDLGPRTASVSLIEAAQPRVEANAIAVAIRDGIEAGRTIALVTPDRTLARRVSAALTRWNIVPDDSAGRPLGQSAPGRFLRHVAAMMGAPVHSESLIALLKHPLTRTDSRGPHLLETRELELFLRRSNILVPKAGDLSKFQRRIEQRQSWSSWVAELIRRLSSESSDVVSERLAQHVALAEWISQGPESPGTGTLWSGSSGRDTLSAIVALREASSHAPPMSQYEYARLIDRVFGRENTRDVDTGRSDVMIWGTLEARVQGADLVILGGLNEGTWPERPSPDPWLSRDMRAKVGLLMPDREIGLAAHDFQQAIAAPEVILSRALRDAEAEAVPSRWLNRLTNLLNGLPDQGGPEVLKAMRQRGERYVNIAAALDAPDVVEPEPRPAPAPPVSKRPTSLAVTDIQRLIRDPYAIYARYVLGLRALNPLRPEPGPMMRGTVFHLIMERFVRNYSNGANESAVDRLINVADEVLDAEVPWLSTRALWRGHIASIADRVVASEVVRQAEGMPVGLEVSGQFAIGGTRFDIRGKADRIDRRNDGALTIYDYKTGKPPKKDVVRYFDKQLLIEAVMAEAGAFADIPAAEVARVAHIGLGRTPTDSEINLMGIDPDYDTVTIAGELRTFLLEFDNAERGYVARRAMEKVRYEGEFDHLARFGEWDETADPIIERLP